jgi:hypothetical protein
MTRVPESISAKSFQRSIGNPARAGMPSLDVDFLRYDPTPQEAGHRTHLEPIHSLKRLDSRVPSVNPPANPHEKTPFPWIFTTGFCERDFH